MTTGRDESLQFESVDIASFPEADVPTFDYQTENLQTLGFELVSQYRVLRPEQKELENSFARLLSHSSYNCFAEVYQFRLSGAQTAVMYSIISLLEDGWRVSTIGYEPSAASSLLASRPKAAWASHPGADVFSALATHLKMRQRLTTRRGLSVVCGLSPDAMFDEMRRASFEQRELLSGLSESELPRALAGHPKTHWWGADSEPA